MRGVLAHGRDQGTRAADGTVRSTDRIALTMVLASMVALLGLVGSVVFGLLWWNTSHGESANVAASRDQALAAARQIAVNLQTLDYKTVDKGLDTWEASATGPLLHEFQAHRKQYAAQIVAARTATTARLVDAALSDLDVAAGRATAIAAVDVSASQAADGAHSLPTTKPVRIQLNLVRTSDAGWKAAAAGPVPS
jgi:Mce-associated membrane protein